MFHNSSLSGDDTLMPQDIYVSSISGCIAGGRWLWSFRSSSSTLGAAGSQIFDNLSRENFAQSFWKGGF